MPAWGQPTAPERSPPLPSVLGAWIPRHIASSVSETLQVSFLPSCGCPRGTDYSPSVSSGRRVLSTLDMGLGLHLRLPCSWAGEQHLQNSGVTLPVVGTQSPLLQHLHSPHPPSPTKLPWDRALSLSPWVATALGLTVPPATVTGLRGWLVTKVAQEASVWDYQGHLPPAERESPALLGACLGMK